MNKQGSILSALAGHVVDLYRLARFDFRHPHSYSKVRDSKIILAAADPLKIAENSRSFRRLMRIIGHELYRSQSVKAIKTQADRPTG